MTGRKRILILENSVHVTGALKSIVRLSYDLKSYFDFVFVIPSNSQAKNLIRRFGFEEIHELPMRELSRSIVSILFYFPVLISNTISIHRIVSRENIAMIHSNDLYNLIPVFYKLSGGHLPYITHIRFLPIGFPSFLYKCWFFLHSRWAKRIIVVSKFLQSLLPEDSKIVCVPNELPISESHPPQLLKNGLKNDYTFLYLGNYIPGKGQNYALEAFSAVAQKLPNWRLRFVGGDMGLKKNQQYRQWLILRSRELGIDDRVEWQSFSDDTELEYKRADAVLNFSEAESFSITCLEALFWGRPLIASDCGGPAEIVDDNETGLLVENRNTEAMAKAMYRLGRDEQLRYRLGHRAKAVSRERFGIEQTSMRLKGIYEEVIRD